LKGRKMKSIAVLVMGQKGKTFAVIAEPFTIKKMPWLQLCVHETLDRYGLFTVSEMTTGTAIPGAWESAKIAKKLSAVLILDKGEKEMKRLIAKAKKGRK
jgi:hypothetical protein